MDVIVIGGGITGLSAAFELAGRDVGFLLLEASSRTGGLILTDRVDGFTIEAGPDSILAQKPAGLRLCDELGLAPRLIATTPPRRAYILKNGRLHALPSPSILGIPTTWRGIAEFDLLPLAARARLAAEPLVRTTPKQEDESVAAFFRRRFGAASVELIAEPLLGGIHAGDVESLSVRSLFPRLAEAEVRRGSVLRSFRRSHPHAGGEGLFRSLASGMGELVTALERRLPEGSVHLSMPATSIRRTGEGWRVFCGRQAFDARALVLAVPAHVAASILAPVDRAAAELCAEVPYTSTASVALAWPRASVPHPLEGSGFVVARRQNALRITACTWVSSKWKGRAPAGSALLRAFIGGAHDPDAAALDDDELIDIAVRDIGQTLGISDRPQLTRVYRWHRAGAQHNVGQLARVARIEERLAAVPGLYVAGSGFRSVGIPDCVADGRAAADAAARYVKMAPVDGDQ
jgi:oxygen-dependent protoporphyrinogen oxidase